MSELPGSDGRAFTLELDSCSNGNKGITCEPAVRQVPRRRVVARGQWQGKNVFVKVFASRRHWQREVDGLHALQEGGIACARLRYSGTADQGRWPVVVLQAIAGGEDVLTRWRSQRDQDGRMQLLASLVDLFAAHHDAGLVQRDPHLANFLLAGDVLYTLDAGDIQRRGDPVPVSASLHNLGLLLAQVPAPNDAWLRATGRSYLSARGLAASPRRLRALVRSVRRWRRYRLRKYLAKTRRSCSEFICRRSAGRRVAYRRDHDSQAFRRFLLDPDATLDSAGSRLLKAGNTSTVWRCEIDGRPMVVKRYNIKGLWHRMSRALRMTRAARSWRNAHRLMFLGIPTPTPLAVIERRRGPFRGRAWLVCEAVDGPTLREYVAVQGRGSADARESILAAERLLDELAANGFSHGDMKDSNILVASSGPVLTDLDALRAHRVPFWAAYRQSRDRDRFRANWN